MSFRMAFGLIGKSRSLSPLKAFRNDKNAGGRSSKNN
jgi:hypothetical protein